MAAKKRTAKIKEFVLPPNTQAAFVTVDGEDQLVNSDVRWKRTEFRSIFTESECLAEPSGKIGIVRPGDGTIGGFHAERGWYIFLRNGFYILVHKDDIEVINAT